MLWAEIESEEVRFQTAAEGRERVCSSGRDGKRIPQLWCQEGKELGTCGALARCF